MKRKTIKQQRARAGFLFILPWLIGIIVFFLQAMFNLLRYSFTNFEFVQGIGYRYSELSDGIFSHYKYSLITDSLFPQKLTESLGDMLYRVPIILVFSLFVAIVLNQKFKGRGMMRAIFFIPILISSGVIASIIKTSLTTTVMGSGGSGNIFSAALLTDMLYEFGLPASLVNQIGSLVSNVTDLIWGSSVQIIVFLMGLLTIPHTYYEVAQVEGATGWETFWKVTFPAVSPYILVNIIYTAIDHFINYDNQVMKYILEAAFTNYNYSYASAMSWIYFIVIIVTLVLLILLTSLFIPFKEKKIKNKKKGRKAF
ncbi:MAG: sugar ABC transporter permease [Ruminococcaceae bacterium]|nr:sugar ABC transporter permease [Oscillospiraceae bacterium]